MQVVRSSLLFNNLILLCFAAVVKCEQQARQSSSFSESLAKQDVSMNDLRSDYSSFMSILNSIAIKRVSGTAGNQIVRQYLVESMKNYGWNVEVLPFSDRTPYGMKDFANVVATYPIGRQYQSNPKANTNTNNRIVFACHYDSKYFNGYDFIGATDSAVPCAILVDIAKHLYENYNPSKFSGLYRHLQFIFFDGEEAFGQWTSTDSLYGARNYAANLKKMYGSTAFNTMDLFVLLDLVGGDATRYLNYFPQTTSNAYRMLNSIEKNLKNKGMLSGAHSYFTDLSGLGRNSGVEDDHLPFLRQNVPILHLIPSSFPSQWHTMRDNVQNLDMNHVQDMRLIMKNFVLQILNDSENKQETLNHRADDEF